MCWVGTWFGMSVRIVGWFRFFCYLEIDMGGVLIPSKKKSSSKFGQVASTSCIHQLASKFLVFCNTNVHNHGVSCCPHTFVPVNYAHSGCVMDIKKHVSVTQMLL